MVLHVSVKSVSIDVSKGQHLEVKLVATTE